MALIKHFETDTWAYWSPVAKYEPNTFVTTDTRKFYVGGPGAKATDKISPPDEEGLPVGMLLTFDMEEYNQDIGYHRLLWFKDLQNTTQVPAWITDYFEELYPGEPEKWQLWYDHSGVKIWTDPVIPPEPEPEPIEPEPEPVPDPELPKVIFEFDLFGKHYVLTSQRLL